ncbi:galactose-1-phosphate uridylyltransferase [Lichtheimia hyalospora FSU 10163]|nr:galactose-1-phosphate uridylyltransferase [Lichtheimia hyalospora FSU 10163]
MSFDLTNDTHRRYNPLNRTWVLCSPHRTQRPWQGQQEKVSQEKKPEYDTNCYLCPGNTRAHGDKNPEYTSTFVFRNDFAALRPDQPSANHVMDDDLLRVQGVRGDCLVVCFSPRHDLTMAEMDVDTIHGVIQQWTQCYRDMTAKDYINYVQIFENKGSAMGCSNPHPHGQMWCMERIPIEPQRELDSLNAYRDTHHGRCLLCDYAKREIKEKERIVVENDSFMVIVPFWAVWPFETLVLAKDHIQCLSKMTDDQQRELADVLRRITCRYDNLFECPFPYSMGIHQSPVRGNHDEAHLHIHFYPPLLRSATVRKFLVGFEMLGEPQRDITPEMAAEKLREQEDVHYKHCSS